MRKQLLFVLGTFFIAGLCPAQVDKSKYPEPEFANEVYWLKKEDTYDIVRLEKLSSKMETKTKLGGMGGAESGYVLPGEKSSVRLSPGNLSFVFSTGASASTAGSSSTSDSVMRANGIDPAMMSGMGGYGDPSNSISLYKTESNKGVRKILLMKMPGMGLGSKKNQSSDKITFSVRKIREGYFELVIDKPLSKGEYAFQMMSAMGGGMDQSSLVFAFGVD